MASDLEIVAAIECATGLFFEQNKDGSWPLGIRRNLEEVREHVLPSLKFGATIGEIGAAWLSFKLRRYDNK